jgi:cytochrome c oxidase accessory protein FixG
MAHELDKLAREAVETADVTPVNKPAERALYKKREQIYPQRVNGRFRSFKWFMMTMTLSIYYLVPWIRWDRGPGVPDQAVLLDLPARRFYFFFIEIWPQEIYYVTGLLILASFGLFLATSLAGRVWCGYSCPQTVWTDLFLVIERLFEGRRNERIKLDKAPWSVNKFLRKTGKHIVWLIIAVMTGGAWVFYFADAPTLARGLAHLSAPSVAYMSIGVLTFTTYLLGGFAREQVCTYMCPWPRIQAALTDAESLAVTYRYDRGEPRGPHKAGDPWEGRGDCIDCKQCVVVCPMGIDIRDGAQLECIQCALCIDACHGVMEKIGRPVGLIAYDTDANIQRRLAGEKPRFKLIRVRTVTYAALILLVAGIMFATMATRGDFSMNVLRDRNPLFVMESDGSIRNGYTIKILNKAHAERTFEISLEDMPNAELKVIGMAARTGNPIISVPSDSVRAIRLFVRLPHADVPEASVPVEFELHDIATGVTVSEDTSFKGPGQ